MSAPTSWARRALSQPAALVFAGLVVGASAGLLSHAFVGEQALEWFVRRVTEPVGRIFLRLLLVLVIPLLFSALVIGIAGMDLRRFGRVGLETLGATVLMSLAAVLLGVSLVNLVRPGEGVPEEVREALLASLPDAAVAPRAAPPGFTEFFVELVPDNAVEAMAEGNMLALVVFSILFGVGLLLTASPAAAKLREVLEGLYDVCMTLIRLVIALAPIGVAALVFTTTARLGPGVLEGVGRYVFVVLVALAIHLVVVYSIVVRLGGMHPRVFFRGIRLAMLTAFSTASSNATLPTAIRVADEELRLPRSVSRFVLTVGATMNQNGTALFEGVTVLFLAQLYGVDLTTLQQVVVVAICVLAGIGTAGVPAGSIPVVMMVLAMVRVPPEGIGLVLGIDRFLDMCRTTLNVSGDLAVAVFVSRREKRLAPD